MSSETPSKEFLPVQMRVSRRLSPLLFERLASEPLDGDAASTIVRRLAEEALLLRNHPLVKAVQALDLKGISSTELFNGTGPVNVHKNEVLANGTPQLNNSVAKEEIPQEPQNPAQKPPEVAKTPSSAQPGGSMAMAALMVTRHGPG